MKPFGVFKNMFQVYMQPTTPNGTVSDYQMIVQLMTLHIYHSHQDSDLTTIRSQGWNGQSFRLKSGLYLNC